MQAVRTRGARAGHKPAVQRGLTTVTVKIANVQRTGSNRTVKVTLKKQVHVQRRNESIIQPGESLTQDLGEGDTLVVEQIDIVKGWP